MKFILTIALLFLSIISYAKSADCDTAPKNSITELPEPFKKWFDIECDVVLKGHFLTANKSFKWKVNTTGKDYKFDAYGPIPPEVSILQRNLYEPHKHYFVGIKHAPITPAQLKGVNQLLSKSSEQYDDVLQLDLKTNTKVLYSFFIFLKNSNPDWIVACVNYNCNKTLTVKVSPATE